MVIILTAFIVVGLIIVVIQFSCLPSQTKSKKADSESDTRR
jgi:hypothetical protein